ncbi:MAG: ABC transporter substrate-binding protein, partial [Acutalibacteraceae bacterium]
DKVADGSVLSMGCLVVSSDYLEDETNKDAFDKFLSLYQKSVDFVNANPKEAGQLSQNYSIMEAAVAEKAIPRCNIVYIAGKEMKEGLTPFWNVLYESNPASIGGALPDDSFYYEAE